MNLTAVEPGHQEKHRLVHPVCEQRFLMHERVMLRRTWRCGAYGGTLAFTAGSRDDYLELRANEQDWPEALKEVDVYLPGDLSLKSFADGRGLGILRLLTGAGASIGLLSAEERLRTLTELLADVFPGLRWENECLVLASVRMPERHSGPARISSEPSATRLAALETPERVVGAQEDQLELASRAVERGQFGHAERYARQAQRQGDPTAAAFLEALTRIRRMTRTLRRYPRDAQAHLELGWALLLTGASDQARQAAQTVLELDPRLGCAHALLGMDHLARGNVPDAWTAYDTARANTSEDDPHLKLLAAALRGELPGMVECVPH